MRAADGRIGIGQRLAKRLYPFTLIIGFVISLGLPTTYYTLQSIALKRTATIYAEELAEDLRELVLSDGTLWKYQAYKYLGILRIFLPRRDVTTIRVLDEAGRPIPQYEHGAGAAHAWWDPYAPVGSAPLTFNNRRIGSIEVSISRGPLLEVTLGLLVLSTSLGVGIALLVHFFPVRVVQQMEGQIEDLLDSVERSNATLERRAAEQKSLFEAGRLLAGTLQVSEVLQRLAELARTHLAAGTAVIWLREGPQGDLRLSARAGDARYSGEVWTRFGPGEWPVGSIVDHQASLSIPDLRADPHLEHAEWARREGLVSFLGVPLILGGTPLGVLAVITTESHVFAPEEMALLEALATPAAIAIRNARLFEAMRQREDHLHTLLATNQKIGALGPLEALLECIAEEAARLLAVEASGFRLLEGDELVLAGTWGESREAMRRPRIPRDESLSGWVVTHGQPLVLPNIVEDPRFLEEHRRGAQRLGHKAFLGVPLKVGKRVTGVLTFRAKGQRQFTDTDVQLATTFADQAALAIENARLLQESRARQNRLEALVEVNRQISLVQPLRPLLDTIAEACGRLLDSDSVGFRLMEGDDLAISGTWGDALEVMQKPRLKVGESLSGWVASTGEVAVVADVANDPRVIPEHRDTIRRMGYRAWIGVPVKIGDRVVGVLSTRTRRPQGFGPEDVAVATAFAAQAALAIQNARLFQEEQERRRQVEAVRAVTEEITRELDLPALLKLIAHRAAELSKTTASVIYVWDEEAQVLVPRAWHGFTEWIRDLRLRLGEGLAGAAAQRRERVQVSDYRTSPHAHPLVLKQTDLTAAVAEPLLHHDRLVGVIVITNQGSGRSFSEQDYTMLSLFASQAAIAIENARLYAEVRNHSETLEQRVRDRTLELEKANRAKSEFLANMSHELRTPLNAIIGFADLLRMPSFGPLTPKQQKYVSNIHGGGVHLLNLVNDVLDLARVEAGRLELRRERTALAPALSEALDGIRPQADAKGLTLVCEAAPDLPAVHADPVRLRQILVNLLSNAVKFTERGGRVTVRAARGTAGQPPEEGVEIHVEDTGTGIAPEDRGRLFRKFEQLEGGLAKPHQGTGLGLALTRQLVELHGGTIAVHSPGRGQGSTFTVRLPVAPHRERPLVLVVDDDPRISEVLACSLREWGCEAAEAATLAEARAAIEREQPDLVILDASMPDGSGTDFVREIRHGPAARVAILMYTGLGAEEGQAALKMGADDYLVKPAPLEVLHRKASKLLAREGWHEREGGRDGKGEAPGDPPNPPGISSTGAAASGSRDGGQES